MNIFLKLTSDAVFLFYVFLRLYIKHLIMLYLTYLQNFRCLKVTIVIDEFNGRDS